MSWDTSGSSIILKDIDLITTKVLTQYFFGMKYSSFIRQVIKTSIVPLTFYAAI